MHITISTVNKQRWCRFKKNRRGYFSFWILMMLFIVSLFANFIANDKPLLIYYKQHYYIPIVQNYSESTFGGTLEIKANYRDPYVKDLIEQHGWMLWPLIRFNDNTLNYESASSFPAPPSFQNLLGTDDIGRDILANLLYGFRISMLFSLCSTFISSLIGICIGALLGYYGGKFDLLGQRFIEIWSGMPTLFLLILLSSMVTPHFFWLLAITLLFGWMSLVGVVRAEFLRTRHFDYVRAAKALGVPDRTIIFRHILPNATVASITYVPFILCGSITTLTSLDFLGFGLPLDYPSLGRLLLQGKNNLQAPWLGICSFLILAIMLSLMLLIGEATRDALNPNQQRGQ